MRCISLFFVIICLGSAAAAFAGITSEEKLINPEFWISVTGKANEVILNGEQIKAFNLRVAEKSPSMEDLLKYPDTVDGEKLRQIISGVNVLSGQLYCNGVIFTDREKEDLIKELNLGGLSGTFPVRYGVSVRRSNLRALPMAEGLFETADDIYFDNLQETAVDPSEPLLILHTSGSGKFFYVQMYNCRGWIAVADVSVTDRTHWLDYALPDKFLSVLARNFFIRSEGENILYQMGSRLLVKDKYFSAFIVLIPRRGADGTLFEDKQLIFVNNENVHYGYMPYTRANLIRESMKFYGAPYGWGGLLESEDCSGLVNDVYRVFGIYLPRNSGQQARTAGVNIPFQGLNAPQRYNIIAEMVSAGDVLCMKGHVMIYLGQADGVPYAVHSLGSHTIHHADGSKEKQRIMKVVVSDLSLKTWAGPEHIEAFTNAVSFR